jgi:hypothetical protein
MGCCASHDAPAPVVFGAPLRSALKYRASAGAGGCTDASTASHSSDRSSDPASVTFVECLEASRRGPRPVVDPFTRFDAGAPPPADAHQLCTERVMSAAARTLEPSFSEAARTPEQSAEPTSLPEADWPLSARSLRHAAA